MVWSSLSDGAILQTACSASKVNTGLNNYIHGGEFVVLTNPSVTDDSRKLLELIRQMYEHESRHLGSTKDRFPGS